MSETYRCPECAHEYTGAEYERLPEDGQLTLCRKGCGEWVVLELVEDTER